MPSYDFLCDSCGHIFELSKKISDRDDTASETCPECATVGQMSRQVGSPLVAYSVTTPGGYGKIPSGFKDVLTKINQRTSRLNSNSSFL